MDFITNELDNKIFVGKDDGLVIDVACYNKIKIDYFLMLTIAVSWDLKHLSMSVEEINYFLRSLQKPETGKLIQLINTGLHLNPNIIKLFDSYKEGRNLLFGHTTFDRYQAERLNAECEQCWNSLVNLPYMIEGIDSIIRDLYREDNDLYYIDRIKQDGSLRVTQFGNKNGPKIFPLREMQARLANKDNIIKEGDLFICVNGSYIKVSPFIQCYEDQAQPLFMMLMDIGTKPLTFKMALLYRTKDSRESERYLDEFPIELGQYFKESEQAPGKNGILLNRFSQYELFQQEFYTEIHQDVINRLNKFIVGNMSYGAVHGVAGVGKTSAVFMWMNNLLNNQDGILDNIRNIFNLRRIIFLSAKKRVFSRDISVDDSNFVDIESDVSNYLDVIDTIYRIFHTQEKKGVSFKDKEDYIANYSNQAHGVLVIIDDYESLPKSSRDSIQELKDSLRPNAIKILITTRFPSKESKDITVELLDEIDCSKMTDHIFSRTDWRNDLSESEMHRFTGGRPLLIWYAKAYYNMGQLSNKVLKKRFSGPAKGLEDYLFDNFVDCFENEFTKNFLMIASRYYELKQSLQISKTNAIFLCIQEAKEYKSEFEEFYFAELLDLKLISINQSANTIDFSPLMTYIEKTSKKQEPTEIYQSDSIKLITHLEERKYKGLEAIIESAKYLEDIIKNRVLRRIVDFAPNDDSIRINALKALFSSSSEKIELYKENTQLFQSQSDLITEMINYILDGITELSTEYDLIREFLSSISTSIERIEDTEPIAYKGLNIVADLLAVSLEERECENITNAELSNRVATLTTLAKKLLKRINDDSEEKQTVIDTLNYNLDDISIYCNVQYI